MNIIDIYDKLKSSYKNYIGSFVSIKDERIKQKVSEAIQDEKLWPKALIQFNSIQTLPKALVFLN